MEQDAPGRLMVNYELLLNKLFNPGKKIHGWGNMSTNGTWVISQTSEACPKWGRDSDEAMKLAIKYKLVINLEDEDGVSVHWPDCVAGLRFDYCEYPSEIYAFRLAVLVAVISSLDPNAFP